jgi:hypothetical protein
MRSYFSYNRSDQRQHHRRIPDDDKSSSSEGVLWGMVVLLFFRKYPDRVDCGADDYCYVFTYYFNILVDDGIAL